MANHPDWITDVIDKAKLQVTNTPEATWTELRSLLKGKLSQKPLPAGELAAVAMQLIDSANATEAKADKS